MKLSALPIVLIFGSLTAVAETEHYVRFEHQGNIQHGKLDGATVYPIEGDLFGEHKVTNTPLDLNDIEVLLPTTPEKVFAVGMNFASHLASPSNQAPPLFLKLPSSLILTGDTIQAPKDARNVHFEGELVLVIGKQVRNVSQLQAKQAIWGVTVGNDLTERNWQGSDLQWMRAKAADGFGPIGATIVTGVDYENVELTTRLNGKIVQQESTKNMIHSPAKVVSYLSQYFTLKPGDLIFMGTPGRTQSLKDNDVISVSIEQVGEVKNKIRFD
ncbi:fumarylacetoacetate hydrolase family protein [Vibrio sp. SCSIO 43136]|uniref:fumarylacetoacetate hydrolase family protein n=1 Tax=Vibrio sp. SCSIO 43136 TaxID=2819101 RepID=UPI002075268B|nr:fumarylacetoacetate hydrolase family protein [Vibrio sp. SCSIO 43136]USD67301.1 fumarylacetoacetate hydrolase family protein [Vibrio sp. SCSIO 43136]